MSTCRVGLPTRTVKSLTMVSEVGFSLVFFVNPEGQICNGMSCLVCLKTSYLLDGWHEVKMDPNGRTLPV